MADRLGLPVAHKPDSQEICFIPDHDYAAFLDRYTGRIMPEGNFVDLEGNVLGRHKGISHYTMGQRKGLNLAMGHPGVCGENTPGDHEVVIGNGPGRVCQPGVLQPAQLDVHRRPPRTRDGGHGKKSGTIIRASPASSGKPERDLVECIFEEPVRAAAPGQAAVFYRDEYVVGGGTIL